MELVVNTREYSIFGEKIEVYFHGWVKNILERLSFLKISEPPRAAGKAESVGKVWQTSDTSDTLDTPVKHHTWSQIILVPVEIVPDPKDGEPVLFIDQETCYRLATEDPRVGCLDCNMSLDEGWDTPCEGAKNDCEDISPLR